MLSSLAPVAVPLVASSPQSAPIPCPSFVFLLLSPRHEDFTNALLRLRWKMRLKKQCGCRLPIAQGWMLPPSSPGQEQDDEERDWRGTESVGQRGDGMIDSSRDVRQWLRSRLLLCLFRPADRVISFLALPTRRGSSCPFPQESVRACAAFSVALLRRRRRLLRCLPSSNGPTATATTAIDQGPCRSLPAARTAASLPPLLPSEPLTVSRPEKGEGEVSLPAAPSVRGLSVHPSIIKQP